MIGGSGFPAAMIQAIAAGKPLPQAKKYNRFKPTKFLLRSDWALAASGGARVKLHEAKQRTE